VVVGRDIQRQLGANLYWSVQPDLGMGSDRLLHGTVDRLRVHLSVCPKAQSAGSSADLLFVAVLGTLACLVFRSGSSIGHFTAVIPVLVISYVVGMPEGILQLIFSMSYDPAKS
jgi:hypothetical protein